MDQVQDAKSGHDKIPSGEAYGPLILPAGMQSDAERARAPRLSFLYNNQWMMDEAARVAGPTGDIFVAFYRASAAVEDFLTGLGLLHNHILLQREALELNRLGSFEMLGWVARKTGAGYFRATFLLIRMALFSTFREKLTAVRMKKIFRQMNDASSLIRSAPEKVPYRNEAEIRNLFVRLGVPLKRFTTLSSCIIAQI